MNGQVIISGGTVVPVNASRSVIRDGAVAVSEGRIVAVGQSKQVQSEYPEAEVIDATGKMLLPGFVNLHVHCALTVTRGIAGELGGAPAYRNDIPQGVLLTPDDTYIMSKLGALQALMFGSTTIVENYIHADANAKAIAETGIRAIISERLHDADLFGLREGKYTYDIDRGKDLLQENERLIEHWHGFDGGRITCAVGPHGPDTASPDLLKLAKSQADKYGMGMVIHLGQSAAELSQVRKLTGHSSVAHLANIGILGSRLIAGHCAFLDDGDAEILAQSGTNVCQLPIVNAKSGWIAPAQKLRRLGVTVGLGTDHMVHDMIEAMRFALCVNRVYDGGPTGIKAMDVLEMATIHGARAINREDELGSIETGKLADLILVDLDRPHLAPVLDPVANLIYAGQSADIDSVMINGQFVVKDHQILTVDSTEVAHQAQQRAESLWEKIAGWKPTGAQGFSSAVTK